MMVVLNGFTPFYCDYDIPVRNFRHSIYYNSGTSL